MVSAWLLVPVKGLAGGKGRLGGCLDARARRALNRYFLQRTLAVARAFPGAGRTLAGRMLLFDALEAEWREVAVAPRAGCAACGGGRG